ncbi:MAG: hypothetical protein NTX52_03600 [Planctomycetota bacterium]|nr:hypothetical protein [Planctomycetota bacterium]
MRLITRRAEFYGLCTYGFHAGLRYYAAGHPKCVLASFGGLDANISLPHCLQV